MDPINLLQVDYTTYQSYENKYIFKKNICYMSIDFFWTSTCGATYTDINIIEKYGLKKNLNKEFSIQIDKITVFNSFQSPPCKDKLFISEHEIIKPCICGKVELNSFTFYKCVNKKYICDECCTFITKAYKNSMNYIENINPSQNIGIINNKMTFEEQDVLEKYFVNNKMEDDNVEFMFDC